MSLSQNIRERTPFLRDILPILVTKWGIGPYAAGDFTGVAPTAGTVYGMSFEVPYPCTMSGVTVCFGGTVGTNTIRVGLYGPDPDPWNPQNTPEGLPLVGESAVTAIDDDYVERLIELTVGDVDLTAGVYWVFVQTSGAVDTLVHLTGYAYQSTGDDMVAPIVTFAQAYGAFPDPCPACTAGTHGWELTLRLSSIP